MKLVALKKLRYPRGPNGKEYNVGDGFEALSERDAKALTLVRAAAPYTDQTAKGVAPLRTASMAAAKSDATGSLLPPSSDDKSTTGRRRYLRRDLTATEE